MTVSELITRLKLLNPEAKVVMCMESIGGRVRRKLKSFVYRLIRPLFVKGIDPNEDYNCGWCGEPVLTRVLFCSVACSEKVDEAAEKTL